MEFLVFLVKVMATFMLLGFIGGLTRLFEAFILKPNRIRSQLKSQGIQGPPPYFLVGNLWDVMKTRFKDSKLPQRGGQVISHNYSATVVPFIEKWRKQYGSIFMLSLGNLQILCMSDPNVLKELTTHTSSDLGRPSHLENNALVGQGILATNGEVWARQRKILAPLFFMDKVKGMMRLTIESALSVVNSLKDKIDNEGGVADLKIDEYSKSFAGDVISRACFASNYEEGKEIFLKLRALQEIVAKNIFLEGIPGMRYVPTKSNREIWRLEKEFRGLILKMVKEREEETSYSEKDLLQIILETAERGDLGQAKHNFIVDNCKNIYFAGHETTALSAAWALMLFALYPEWQDRVRSEIFEVCAGDLPKGDMLPKLKTLTMVINETLRLYSPGFIVPREALEDMKLGDINVPQGVNVWIPVGIIHQDPNIWGVDADKFNPERFSNGVSGACKLPYMFMPFGFGPHTCLGQQFAITELRIFLTLMLSNFTFTLSPNYIHSPILTLVIEPEHGIDLLLRRV